MYWHIPSPTAGWDNQQLSYCHHYLTDTLDQNQMSASRIHAISDWIDKTSHLGDNAHSVQAQNAEPSSLSTYGSADEGELDLQLLAPDTSESQRNTLFSVAEPALEELDEQRLTEMPSYSISGL